MFKKNLSSLPKKLLAIKLRSLGDSILFTSSLFAIQETFPQAQLDVLVPDSYKDLFEHFPPIRTCWTWTSLQKTRQDSKKSFLTAWMNVRLSQLLLIKTLGEQNYDAVLNFHASPSSARLAYLTGAKTRAVHFHDLYRKNHFSTVFIPGKGKVKPILERDLDTVNGLASALYQPISPKPHPPKIFLTPSEKKLAQHQLDSLKIPQPILGISLSASRPTKCWPLENFAKLALAWCQPPIQGGVLVFIGPSELPLRDSFLATWNRLHPKNLNPSLPLRLLDPLPLRNFASMLGSIDLLLCNDSGPKHLAAAVSTPTVSLFGPEHPYEWHPYDTADHPYCFVENLTCRKSQSPGMPAWCGLETCTLENHRCMRSLEVEHVLEHCQNRLKLSL